MEALFLSSVFLIVHSYLLYPAILFVMSFKKKLVVEEYTSTDNLPFVSVIMAAHNEETVIVQKIESIFNTTYPKEKLELIIGSDCSSDATNRLVSEAKAANSAITFIEFSKRQGKIGVMNHLVDLAKGEVIISTDANVMMTKDTIFNLVKYFKDNTVGLVDTNMINTNIRSEGISKQESTYITFEVNIKHREAILWGSMIGPFGGCYAVRKANYKKPPSNCLVDDFYINMQVLREGKKAVNCKEAVVYEDVSNNLTEEYRRKVRISTGNFQNLFTFWRMLWPPTGGLAFSFLSHKVLRWFGPIFLITIFFSNLFLLSENQLFVFLFIVQLTFYSLPIIDLILRKSDIHLLALRFATHFISMNAALLVGLIKYLKGVESNVWQPTQRNQ